MLKKVCVPKDFYMSCIDKDITLYSVRNTLKYFLFFLLKEEVHSYTYGSSTRYLIGIGSIGT